MQLTPEEQLQLSQSQIDTETPSNVEFDDFVTRIYNFNQQAGLLDSEYSDYLESSFQIEEALEGFDLVPLSVLVGSHFSDAKSVSRAIVGTVDNLFTHIPDVDRLDKACDAVVFAIGSMAKLGLSPNHIHAALNIVMDANQAKLSCPRDSHGKLTKPANFPSPEPRLQALLDSCSHQS